MGMDWTPTEDPVLDDAALIRAARKRLLRMLEAEESPTASIVNNVGYGGGGSGLMEKMGTTDDPSDREYFVDILREDLPEINEATGKPKGWKKSVHRHSALRGK